MDYFAQVVLLSAGAVALIHQILKLNFIPVAFANKYPVPTNIVLSLIASGIAVWKTTISVHGFNQWAALVGTVSLVAALTYNQLLAKWDTLKNAEGTGTPTRLY